MDDSTDLRRQVRTAFSCLLGREPSPHEVEAVSSSLGTDVDPWMVAASISSSAEHIAGILARSVQVHLHLLHAARSMLVATELPPARRIVDLGGAHAPLYEMGYRSSFERLFIVDLPSQQRFEEFRDQAVVNRQTAQGPISLLYTDMADLSAIPTGSIDLVWSGESLEHVTIEHARRVLKEVRRVIGHEGTFCLDTPNRLITEIHVGSAYIHPDHRFEYSPRELTDLLVDEGFEVVQSLGICDMPRAARSRTFDYREFITGAAITASVDTAYLQYHRCRARFD